MMIKGKIIMFSWIFALSFFYLQPLAKMAMSHSKIDRITTAKDAEEEGDEEDKKRMDQNEKVTSELTARAIIASSGLTRACVGTWSRTRWGTLRIIWMTE